MSDIPYTRRRCESHIVSTMTKVCTEVQRVVASKSENGFLLGVQILAGCNREALAVALASGVSYFSFFLYVSFYYSCCSDFHFIRAEGFVFAHVADEGMINSDAGDLLRYRKAIGANHISIMTDIKKKHRSSFLPTFGTAKCLTPFAYNPPRV